MLGDYNIIFVMVNLWFMEGVSSVTVTNMFVPCSLKRELKKGREVYG